MTPLFLVFHLGLTAHSIGFPPGPLESRQGGVGAEVLESQERAGGILVSPVGAPLIGVEIRLFQSRMTVGVDYPARRAVEVQQEDGLSAKTNVAGHFELGTEVAADGRYYLAWDDGPAAAAVSGWLTGKELLKGVTLEAVPRRVVSARLLDSEGAALAGARVTLRRSGVSATTDADGGFKLEDVPAQPEVVLVQTSDGRTTWGLLDSAGEVAGGSLELRVAFAWTTPPAPVAVAGVRSDLATRLLSAALDAAVAGGNPLAIRSSLDALAEGNLGAALARLDGGLLKGASRADFLVDHNCGMPIYYDPRLKDGASLDEYVRARLRSRSAPEDLKARAACYALESRPFVWAGQDKRALRALPVVDQRREMEARVATELERTSKVGRIIGLSTASCWAYDLGLEQEAQEIFRLAEAEVEPAEVSAGTYRGYLEALCRLDLDRGLRIARGYADQTRRDSALMAEAKRLASADPEVAEALLTEVMEANADRDGSARLVASRLFAHRLAPIVYAMASVDVVRAERLASTYDPSGNALGGVALAWFEAAGSAAEEAARRTPALAMLERAFEVLEPDQSSGPRAMQGDIIRGAALLGVAVRVDPAGAHAWIDRVLRLPLPARSPFRKGRSDGEFQEAEASLAWALAARCPEVSSALTFSALRTAGCEPDLTLDSSDGLWSIAATLDPERASTLALADGGEALTHVGLALARSLDERRRRAQWTWQTFWSPPIR